MAKWHVRDNEINSMPETPATCYKNKRAAERGARDIASYMRDNGYKVRAIADGYLALSRYTGEMRIVVISKCEENCPDSIE